MTKDRIDIISEEEGFTNSYFLFLEALKVLSSNVDVQCNIMGNFNVAWEIKDDVSRGVYLLDSPIEKLSFDEKKEIEKLMKLLSLIPDYVLVATNTEDDNKKAMSNPCWLLLREEAKKLLQMLQSNTTRRQQL